MSATGELSCLSERRGVAQWTAFIHDYPLIAAYSLTICKADLSVRLDLKQIALRCRNTEFNPRRFAAVIMRLREPRATALVFASGKLVITGTKSCHNSSLATKKIAYILERVGFQPSSHINFKVQNMVGTGTHILPFHLVSWTLLATLQIQFFWSLIFHLVDVGFPIRLEGVAFSHPTFSSYGKQIHMVWFIKCFLFWMPC